VSHLFVETWGDGTPAVLVHGSLATRADEWQAQRLLGEQGYQSVVWKEPRSGVAYSRMLDTRHGFSRSARLAHSKQAAAPESNVSFFSLPFAKKRTAVGRPERISRVLRSIQRHVSTESSERNRSRRCPVEP
jgi:hypothetical protein